MRRESKKSSVCELQRSWMYSDTYTKAEIKRNVMWSSKGNKGERSIEYPALEELVADQKGCEVAELSIKGITGIAGLRYLIKDYPFHMSSL